MQIGQHFFVRRFLWFFVLSPLLGQLIAVGQHTEVKRNGVNGKIELDYDAAGRVTETRTIGPDGKVQQKVDYEYLPGYYGAQQTDTTYWPDGKVRRVARNTYDESSNFTGESIQTYDESGKPIGGHKLTHDPWTGVYRCSEWNPGAQNYKSVPCPAGEEESGGAEAVKQFTYEEVMQHVEAARKTARHEQKIGHMLPATPGQPPITAANREVGIVLPSQVRPGERVSGRVLEDPDQYAGMPGVTVTRVAVPLESTGEASRLWGWYFEASGEGQQRADGPITFVIPSTPAINVTFRQAGNPSHSVSQMLSLSLAPAKKPPSPKFYKAPALCLKGQFCVVSGQFNGDSSKTFAAFEDRPASIIVETADTAYVSIPEGTEPGPRPLFLVEGPRVIALSVAVGEFFIKNNGRELQAGQNVIVFPTLEGAGDIPDALWRTGNFPASNLGQARELVAGFQLGKDRREKPEAEEKHEKGSKAGQEADEKKGGEILLVVKNVTPDQITLRSSRNGMLVFRLGHEAFSRGEFKYDLVVEAKKAGKIAVKGYVIPFLAPVSGQEFPLKSDAAAN